MNHVSSIHFSKHKQKNACKDKKCKHNKRNNQFFIEGWSMEESGRSAGGKAAAAKLSAEERRERAMNAANSRWKDDIPKAIKSGSIQIGDISIPCAVLQDGTRLITQRGMFVALGRNKNPTVNKDPIDNTPKFLSASNLKPFITKELERSWTPIKFRLPKGGGSSGNMAIGYDAKILPHVCNVFLDAKDAGALANNQKHIAEMCRILQRGFSIVGIIALVDEATGFQQIRDRDALQQILEAFLRKELAVWVKQFPDDFYKEIYRLKGWEWKGMGTNRYSVVAKYTTDLIYERLFPGVLEEMKKRCPKDENGRRKRKFHQWLSDEIGIPKLAEHFSAIMALQKASDNWEQFYTTINKVIPKKNSLLQLGLFEND